MTFASLCDAVFFYNWPSFMTFITVAFWMGPTS